jgi:signal transduction histidine kinase
MDTEGDPVNTQRWLAQALGARVFEGPVGDEEDLAERVSEATGIDAELLRTLVTEAMVEGRAARRVDGRRVVTLRGGPETCHVAVLEDRSDEAERAAEVLHEVANHLTAMAGWAELADRAGPLPDRTREALTVVRRAGRDALEDARGLLRSMRGDVQPQAKGPAEPARVDLTVDSLLSELTPVLRKADVEAAARTWEVWTSASPAALRTILSNLLRNAAEALAPTGGRIDVLVERRDQSVVIEVQDDGPGLTEELQGKVFERYFTTKPEGTGLGLALVRQAVTAAGGTIALTSAPGLGTTFTVTLPATSRPSRGEPRRDSGVLRRPSLRGTRVLVVDDDESVRSFVETALSLVGAEVTSVADRTGALACEDVFDLALVDLDLGSDAGGDVVVGELRSLGMARRIVVMSGATSLDPALGADAFLPKPFDIEELTDLVQRLGPSTAAKAK